MKLLQALLQPIRESETRGEDIANFSSDLVDARLEDEVMEHAMKLGSNLLKAGWVYRDNIEFIEHDNHEAEYELAIKVRRNPVKVVLRAAIGPYRLELPDCDLGTFADTDAEAVIESIEKIFAGLNGVSTKLSSIVNFKVV